MTPRAIAQAERPRDVFKTPEDASGTLLDLDLMPEASGLANLGPAAVVSAFGQAARPAPRRGVIRRLLFPPARRAVSMTPSSLTAESGVFQVATAARSSARA